MAQCRSFYGDGRNSVGRVLDSCDALANGSLHSCCARLILARTRSARPPTLASKPQTFGVGDTEKMIMVMVIIARVACAEKGEQTGMPGVRPRRITGCANRAGSCACRLVDMLGPSFP